MCTSWIPSESPPTVHQVWNEFYNLTQFGLRNRLYWGRASLVAQSIKNLPAVQETGVQSLGWEDPLQKEMATPSSILAWKISWRVEAGGLQSIGLQRVGHD